MAVGCVTQHSGDSAGAAGAMGGSRDDNRDLFWTERARDQEPQELSILKCSAQRPELESIIGMGGKEQGF